MRKILESYRHPRHPKSGRSGRRRWLVFAAVLLAAGCAGDSAENMDGQDLPASHPVVSILDEEPGFDEFGEAAGRAGLAPLCARGGWQLCLVQADGLLVVVSFDNPSGTVVRITGDGIEGEMVVPAEGNEAHGLPSTGGTVTAIVEDALGAEIGGTGGHLSEEGD